MESTLHRAIARIASTNYGVISRAAARSCGLTDRQIDGLVARGEWERAASAVYRVASTPLLARTPLAVALAATGGVASHRSAAELLGLLDTVPAAPEILLRGANRYRGPVVVHRTILFEPADRARTDGLYSTNVARTLFDLGGVLSEFELEGLVHRALSARRVTRSRLIERFDALASRGRVGTAAMRAILDRMPSDQPALESHVEVRIIDVLRRHGVPLPDRQVVVHIGRANYRLDFAYRDAKVFLEGDGFGIHARRDVFESDRLRQNALVIAGWLPLRYTDRALRLRPSAIASEVRSVVIARSPASVHTI